MSVTTLILGESGTGKTASLRNLPPESTALIQAVKKPLPFRGDMKAYVCRDWAKITRAVQATDRKIIVIDDYQYLLALEFLDRNKETGFTKFTELAKSCVDLMQALAALPDDVRVYILSHTTHGEDGVTRFKTIGKLLDEKVTVEGLFTIVLRTIVTDSGYWFSCRNNGADTVKSPIGLFEDDRIENDLNEVDKAICEYYGINRG